MSQVPETHGHTPQSLAAKLRGGGGGTEAAAAAQQVCLGVYDNGYAYMSWSAQTTGKYDWVGYYENAGKPEDDKIAWDWVDNRSSGRYDTRDGIRSGSVARYYVWDTASGKYKVVAQTPGFPGNVCS